MTKEARLHNGEAAASSINGTGQLHVKKNKSLDTIKLLEENTGRIL